jgi:hypothetical protein
MVSIQQRARWECLRSEDHLLNVSRKDISANVPIVLNIETVAPSDRVGRHFGDYRPQRPQFHPARPQQPNEGLGKVLIVDDNGPLVLPQGSPQLRLARYTHGNRRSGLWRFSANVFALQRDNIPTARARRDNLSDNEAALAFNFFTATGLAGSANRRIRLIGFA